MKLFVSSNSDILNYSRFPYLVFSLEWMVMRGWRHDPVGGEDDIKDWTKYDIFFTLVSFLILSIYPQLLISCFPIITIELHPRPISTHKSHVSLAYSTMPLVNSYSEHQVERWYKLQLGDVFVIIINHFNTIQECCFR